MNDDADRSVSDEPARHVPYEVDLPGFSGPLELLLHLIRKHTIDILDIPVSFITQKYLEYLEMMRVLNLDVASEYLEMAATLAHIKSRMLLPPGATEEIAQGGEPEDPRAELVRRLLEYQRYRDAADRLLERDLLHRDVFSRPAGSRAAADSERPLGEVGLGALLDAFARLVRRANLDVARDVTVERVSVAERIQEIVDLLRGRKRVVFDQLFGRDVTRADIVVTLLALLEMTRLRMTRLLQADPEGPLYVDFVGDAETAAAEGES